VQGKNADLPPVPERFTSRNFRELFVYARKELATASKLAVNDKLRKTVKKRTEFTVDKDVL
ncbi:hypothetical protein BG006_002476, partial [Podila minutissima]